MTGDVSSSAKLRATETKLIVLDLLEMVDEARTAGYRHNSKMIKQTLIEFLEDRITIDELRQMWPNIGKLAVGVAQ